MGLWQGEYTMVTTTKREAHCFIGTLSLRLLSLSFRSRFSWGSRAPDWLQSALSGGHARQAEVPAAAAPWRLWPATMLPISMLINALAQPFPCRLWGAKTPQEAHEHVVWTS